MRGGKTGEREGGRDKERKKSRERGRKGEGDMCIPLCVVSAGLLCHIAAGHHDN